MRSRRSKEGRAGFSVEMLESRTLLQGSGLPFSVKVDEGDLVIKSREPGQCVEITQDGDTITVADCSGGSEGDFTTTKVSENIRISLRGDDNEIRMTDVRVPENLEIKIGGPGGGEGG